MGFGGASFGFPGMQQQPSSVPEIIVPARVTKAMEFIEFISYKRIRRPAATDHTVEIVEPERQSDEEGTAYATACNLLNEYFGGKLKPDEWEQIRFDAIKKRLETGNRSGAVIACFGCGAGKGRAPNPGCELCKGTGTLFVSSMTQGNQEE